MTQKHKMISTWHPKGDISPIKVIIKIVSDGRNHTKIMKATRKILRFRNPVL